MKRNKTLKAIEYAMAYGLPPGEWPRHFPEIPPLGLTMPPHCACYGVSELDLFDFEQRLVAVYFQPRP